MINPMSFLDSNIDEILVSGTSKNLFATIALVVVLWVIYLVLRFFINQRCKNLKRRSTWRTRAFYSVLALSIYFVGRIWLDSVDNLFTFLSVIAAALTLTQKESLMNLIGCAFIYWRELFHTGDRIQIGDYYGEVTSIRTFYFHMLECDPKQSGDQTTGKIIKVPNGLVITVPVVNLTELFPFTWQELTVILTPDSDVHTARTVLSELVDREVKHYYLESKHYLKKFVRDNFIAEQQLRTQSFLKLHQDEPGGFEITVRYLALPTQKDELQSRVIEKFLDYIKIAKVAKLSFA